MTLKQFNPIVRAYESNSYIETNTCLLHYREDDTYCKLTMV